MATDDISKIFVTETKTVYNIFTSGDSNKFIVPEFQRKFSWSDKEFKRLFDDIKACMNHKNMPLFLGATILCNDEENEKYNDAGRTGKSIIDGQQRFSAFMFISTILYCYLWAKENEIYKFLKDSTNLPEELNLDKVGDLFYSINIERENLLKIFQTKFASRDGGSDIKAPILIRKYEDFWSSKPGESKNTSDIAAYCSSVIDKINGYIDSINQKRTDEARYSIEPDKLIKIIKQSRTASKNNKLKKVVSLLEKQLEDFINERTYNGSIVSGKNDMEILYDENNSSEVDNETLLEYKNYDQSESYSENINEADDEGEDNADSILDINYVLDIIKEKIPENSYKTLEDIYKYEGERAEPLLRLFALTLYFLYRTVVIEVNVTRPDYKFDIFDALNTTGQPLTAFESFYSCVLSDSNIGSLPDVRKNLSEVSDELSSMAKKKENTARMIITYAISFYADVSINNNIQVQRFFMNNQFKVKCRDEVEKKNSVLNFYSVFRIYKDFYLNRFAKKPKGMLSEKINFDAINYAGDRNFKLHRIDQLCMQTLVTSKHRLALAPVAVSYGKFLQGAKEEKEKLFNDFTSVLRIVTAFSTLYRLYTGGQARGIDSVYKDLMTKFLTNDKDKEFKKVDSSLLTPTEVRNQLRNLVPDEDPKNSQEDKKKNNFLNNKSLWTEKVKAINAYESLRPFTQLTLLLVQENTLLLKDDSYELHLKQQKEFKCSYHYENELIYDYQIEHVAPQTNKGAWDSKIYDTKEPVYNCIGNMLVIPSEHNKDQGNQSFEDKIKNIKRNKALTDDKHTELALKHGHTNSFDRTPVQEAYSVLERVYDTRVEGWDKALIEERSKNVADLAYDLLNALFINNNNIFIDP